MTALPTRVPARLPTRVPALPALPALRRLAALAAFTALTAAALASAPAARAAEPAATPEALVARFAQRFNAGDLDGLMALYAPGGVFVPAPGAGLGTPAAIREATAGFLAAKLPIELAVRHVYRTGDLALAVVDWSIRGTAADGRPMSLAGTATDVLRRDAEGGWRYLIDNPFGGARPAP
ncbi:MAG: hypothetical protein RJA99_2391 [Pseudomonadota bacterium]|jgi:uncharacterized protein (TIGR02246 family)